MLSFQELLCLLFFLNTEQCFISHKGGFLLQIPETNCILISHFLSTFNKLPMATVCTNNPKLFW